MASDDPSGFDEEPFETRRSAGLRIVAFVALLGLVVASLALLLRTDPAPRPARPVGPATSEASPPGGPPPSPSPAAQSGFDQLSDLGACLDAEPVEDLPDERDTAGLEAQVRAVARTVEAVRGLRFRRGVEPEFLSDGRFRKRLTRVALSSYGEARARRDERLLEALGALPRGTDLLRLLRRVLGVGVTGFYVPSTEELVVRTSGTDGGLGALDELTLAHELEHALADQRFGLPIGEGRSRRRAEARLAAQALVEGDATLTMLVYSSAALGIGDQLELLFDPTLAAAAELSDIPHYLLRSFEFPYTDGLAFVCDLHGRGGWGAVNRAYERPPRTTAQVLWPQRYHRRDDGRSPRPLRSPGPRWRKDLSQPLGAADLLWLFEAPGGDPGAALPDPLEAAASWDGGRVDVWTRAGESAVGASVLERDASDRLCSSVADWYAAAFPDGAAAPRRPGEALAIRGPEQDAALACAGRTVRLAIAPRLGTARAMLG